MRILYLIIWLLSFCPLFGQTLTATGNWTFSVPVATISEAGNNYTQNFTSNSNTTTINITGTSLLCLGTLVAPDYQIQINRIDTNWDSQLQLYARRSGNGNPTFTCIGCSITNGTTFQQIGLTSQYLFQIRGCYSNIPIQYELRGLSVLVPADVYTTDVYFSIYSL